MKWLTSVIGVCLAAAVALTAQHGGGGFTRNSTDDNLRPVIPSWNDRRTAIVWMRGKYLHNQGEWYSAMVAAIVPAARP